MNKTLTILLSIFLLSSVSYSQSKMNFNNLVEYGGKKFKPNDDEPYTGRVFDLYESGQKKLEGFYKDGLKNQKWTWWYENGQKWLEETYKDGEVISEKCWDEDGYERECYSMKRLWLK